MQPACIEDYRGIARRRLPSFLFGYLDGGSFGELTLRDNKAAWARRRLRQRVLRDVSALEVRGALLGRDVALPLVLAPVGLAGLMRRRGEVQAARAAEAFGVPFCLSTVGVCSIEEVRSESKAPFWFQLYLLRDRGIVQEILARAKAAQCAALVFTVDLARLGIRYSDVRHGVSAQPTLGSRLERAIDLLKHPRWVADVALSGRPLTFGNLTQYVPSARMPEDFKAWVDSQFDPSANWKDIEWLRTRWDGPIILKGILDPDDARMAASVGVEGIVVSNHGGRQLDGAEATADALPRICDAVAGKLTVLVDGGIRYGSDLIRARALGADGVMIGRPWAWALAARGEQGVREVLQILDNELRNSLGLMGHCKLEELSRSSVINGGSTASPKTVAWCYPHVMGFRRSRGFIAAWIALVCAQGCGRVKASPGGPLPMDAAVVDAHDVQDATEPGSDGRVLFECHDEHTPSLHFRYAYAPQPDPANRLAGSVSSWVGNGGDALLSTGLGDLVTLSRDGIPTEFVPGDSRRRVRELSPLADSALLQRDNNLDLVDRTGTTLFTVGMFGAPPHILGLVGATFSESGAAVVLRLGYVDLEHEEVVAVEARGRDGTLLRRIEGVTELLVADAERLFVVASGAEIRALGLDGTELWQATYRASARLIRGSRNGRSIYVHNNSLSLYEGADNSGLLIVDGVPRVVPYLPSPAFSPDGEWVASGGTFVVMHERGEEIWRTTRAPHFLADSVSVNHLGQVLVSGTAPIGDAGKGVIEPHAFLYDHTGTLLTHCVGNAPGDRIFSAFDRDGASVGLYGPFGVVVYDIR